MFIHWLILIFSVGYGQQLWTSFFFAFTNRLSRFELNNFISHMTRSCENAGKLKLYLGNVQPNLKLNFGKGTEYFSSCGATLNGQHWIIGGINEKRQVSDEADKLKKDELRVFR